MRNKCREFGSSVANGAGLPGVLVVFFLLNLAAGPAPAAQAWTTHILDNKSDGVDGVDMHVDSRGYFFMVAPWEDTGEIRLYLQKQRSKLNSAWVVTTINARSRLKGAEDARFIDTGGDGNVDGVVVATEKGERGLYLFTPKDADLATKGPWNVERLTPSNETVAYLHMGVKDLDGDGAQEIIAGSKDKDGSSAHLYYLFSKIVNGKRVWQRTELSSVADRTRNIVFADLDGNKYQDVIISDNKGIHAYMHPGATANSGSRWQIQTITSKPGNLAICSIGGEEQLVTTVSRNQLDKYAGQIFALNHILTQPEVVPLVSINPAPVNLSTVIPKAVTCGDLNNDGLQDLVIVISEGGAGAFVALQNSDGTWKMEAAGPYAESNKYDNSVLFDVDGDGDLDILTGDETQKDLKGKGVMWIENPHIR